MRRREIIATGVSALLAASAPAFAQQSSAKIARIGILTPASNDRTPIFDAFRAGLRDLGYIEGQNVLLEFRLARGDFSLFPQFAAELASIPVNAILVDGGQGVARVAMTVTKNIPIVIATGPNPVFTGLVSSLSRPGGNVTGFTQGNDQLNIKRVEILTTTFPSMSTIAVLVNSSSPNAAPYLKQTDDAARALGISKVAHVEADSIQKLLSLAPAVFAGADGVVVLPDAMLWNHRSHVVALVNKTRLPAIYPEREYADEGGLMAYGANVPDNFRRAATYIDKILKGANPAELPIQEPTRFDFVVNLNTAKALGLTIPSAILARADELIE